MKRDSATLLDIQSAIEKGIAFLDCSTFEAFQNDGKTQSAVLHQLLPLGEAVKRLSEDFRVLHTKIPWKVIAGMRDRLIHSYDDVDLNEVWKTVRVDLPKLQNQIDAVIVRENPSK